MTSITGKNVLIFGGSSGIGYAVAKQCVEQNANVYVTSSNKVRIENAIKSLREETKLPDAFIKGFDCDLSKPNLEEVLYKLFDQVTHDGIDLDHIVFSAGGPTAGRKLKDLDLDYITDVGHVRFVAPLLIGKIGPKYLKNSYTSSFVITTGSVFQKPIPDWTVMGAYAAGIIGMIRSMALELKPIRVNCVSPGVVDTAFWGPEREATMQALSAGTVLGKVGTADEVAQAYVYLMKDSNATGSVISTNGGSLLI